MREITETPPDCVNRLRRWGSIGSGEEREKEDLEGGSGDGGGRSLLLVEIGEWRWRTYVVRREGGGGGGGERKGVNDEQQFRISLLRNSINQGLKERKRLG